MNEVQQQLARRLVEHPAWRWMPGMRAVSDRGESGFARHIETISAQSAPWYQWNDIWLDDAVPDLTDPATVGCMLALAREAWGDPYAACEHRYVTPRMSGWTVRVEQRCDALGVYVSGRSPLEMFEPTEGEAIARAILAAPKKETT